MTPLQADTRDEQARWDDWSSANARSDRRWRIYTNVAVLVALAAITANLVIQLWPRL
jgi:hypothetical protein